MLPSALSYMTPDTRTVEMENERGHHVLLSQWAATTGGLSVEIFDVPDHFLLSHGDHPVLWLSYLVFRRTSNPSRVRRFPGAK